MTKQKTPPFKMKEENKYPSRWTIGFAVFILTIICLAILRKLTGLCN